MYDVRAYMWSSLFWGESTVPVPTHRGHMYCITIYPGWGRPLQVSRYRSRYRPTRVGCRLSKWGLKAAIMVTRPGPLTRWGDSVPVSTYIHTHVYLPIHSYIFVHPYKRPPCLAPITSTLTWEDQLNYLHITLISVLLSRLMHDFASSLANLGPPEMATMQQVPCLARAIHVSNPR